MLTTRLRSTLLGIVGLACVHLTASAMDVAAFWKKTRDELAQVPMDARVVALKEPLPYQTFRVTLRGLNGVEFRCLLALPVRGEGPAPRWPVIVTVPGYGGTQQGIMLGECQRGYAVLQVFPRGQGESAELWHGEGPDKLTWQLDHPEGAYYQGAFADVIRAIDFAASRPDLDAGRIALAGTSQGGGIALAVGALDPRIRTVVAHVPFLCDFPLAAQTKGALVQVLLDRVGKNNAQSLRTLEYFDPLTLAADLKVPVLMSAGGKDPTCPSATIHAVYERLGGIKSLKDYPELPHTTCLEFYLETWPWLERYLAPQAP